MKGNFIYKVILIAGTALLAASLAVAAANCQSIRFSRDSGVPAYRVQPVSLHLGATAASPDEISRTSEAAPSATPWASTNSAEPSDVSVLLAEVRDLTKRIEKLEAERKNSGEPNPPIAVDAPAALPGAQAAASAPATPAPGPGQYLSPAGTTTYFKGDTDLPSHPAGWDPFSDVDSTWMNAAGRIRDSPMSTKYFTPEFRADANYTLDFDHPRDDTLGGSTETFRSDEWQLEQVSIGGDIRIGHVRGRILTLFGEFASTTPRNDPSVARGQWNLDNAYRYISEGWGGYSFTGVGHGLNVDAGIFVSYIGLFSFYNYDNWTYQPSFVSSNTPWFFNGLRVQYYPTAHLKIEPWIINGWQSYARTNSKPGLGGQILWRPKQWLSFVFNNYGLGTDDLGFPMRSRIHTDDSVEIREYNRPDKFLDSVAMSITGDAGCEYGGGLDCYNDKNGNIKQSFLGWMAYQRFQFKHDLFGVTLGGGYLNNPGRYLVLLPPINGANAISGSPYFTGNPGDKFHAYDSTVTFDYMPSQWITFRGEMGYRHSDVDYWSGRNGITPPGGNTGSPSSYVCTNGVSSAVSNFAVTSGGFHDSSTIDSSGDNRGIQNSGGPVDLSCLAQYGTGWHAWSPDLRHSQITATVAIMTRF
jgi:hypothetical protein